MDEQQSFAALHAWFLTPQGQAVASAFVAELQSAHMMLKGKYLLQLGNCGSNPWLDGFAYQAKWVLSPESGFAVASSINALPFDRESMDCIIAPLTLEICARDKHPIDEMDRVLKPMGHMVFLGINPWSLWGASLRWGRLSCFAQVSAPFSSSLSLKHAMLTRGYRQCWLSSFYYLPPIGSEFWLRKLEFLNQMSKMVWPYPAGFYCLIIQKHEPCMTPLRTATQGEFHLARV